MRTAMTVTALALVALTPAACDRDERTLAIWHMVNVNTSLQGDAHLLELWDGTRILIDADTHGRELLPFLRERGVTRLKQVIISHAHKDHYGSLPRIIEAGIEVGEVIFNPPPKAICDNERNWGCDWTDLLRLKDTLTRAGIPLRHASAGDVLLDNPAGRIEVLYAHDGVSAPVGPTDVNDTSLILRFQSGPTRVLFTGDLNRTLGTYLAESDLDLKAHILKVPHHGTEGAAPDAFFRQVGAETALIPAPESLWRAERSRRIRGYFERANIPTWVNGTHGTVTVSFRMNGYTVEGE